jgi:hypothetical protein
MISYDAESLINPNKPRQKLIKLKSFKQKSSIVSNQNLEFLTLGIAKDRVGYEFHTIQIHIEITPQIQTQKYFRWQNKTYTQICWIQVFHPNSKLQQEHAKIQQQHNLVTSAEFKFSKKYNNKIQQKKLSNIKLLEITSKYNNNIVW